MGGEQRYKGRGRRLRDKQRQDEKHYSKITKKGRVPMKPQDDIKEQIEEHQENVNLQALAFKRAWEAEKKINEGLWEGLHAVRTRQLKVEARMPLVFGAGVLIGIGITMIAILLGGTNL